MKSFFSKYLYLLIWIVVIAAIGGIFIYVVQSNLHLKLLPTIGPAPAPTAPAAPLAPPAPSVSLTIEKSDGKNSIFLQWANLPGNTTELEIFRGRTNSTSSWVLWRTLFISNDQLLGGSQNIDLGTSSIDGYSFYVEAVNGGGGTDGISSTTVLWTSGTGVPENPSSTPVTNPTSTGSGSSSPTSTNTSTGSTPPPPASPTSTPSTTQQAPTPTGTPYYNPQVQIETYGSEQTGNFWVQHVDQKIQLGWQNLPPNTTSLSVSRSGAEAGPWSVVLTQQNPDLSNPYTIQVVDDTFGQPFYYELSAMSGTTTIATYGPIYLESGTQ